MYLRGNCRRILFKELRGDQYYLKSIGQDSIKYLIDVGANVGLISIMARLLHPNMTIMAIEPHPFVYEKLVENTNNLRINTFNMALGDGSEMYLKKHRKSDVCNEFSKEKSKFTDITIESLSLFEIINKCKYDVKNLMIKIDCEGAEEYVFLDDDSSKIIRNCKVFSAELHDKGNISLDEKVERFFNIFFKTHIVQIDKRRLGHIVAIRKDYYEGGLK